MFIGNVPQELRVSRKKKGAAVLLGQIPEVCVALFTILVIALVFQTFISSYFHSFSYHFIPLYFNSINDKALQSN